MIGGLVEELAVPMALVPFKYTHLEWASKRKECNGWSFHVVSIYISTVCCSIGICFSNKA
jgi:hypothetical protein